MAEKKLTFEKSLAELEEIVSSMESGELTLDRSLEYFEKGVKLMRICEEHLRGAEGKLMELVKGPDGALIEKALGSAAGQNFTGVESHE